MIISVLGEIKNKELTKTTFEALTKARYLKSDINTEIHLVIIGNIEVDLSHCGSDYVVLYHVDNYIAEETLNILSSYHKKYKPDIMIFTGGIKGSELAPRLAFREDINAILDCTDIRYDKETNNFTITKPIYGGNVFGDFVSETPFIITLRPHQCEVNIKDTKNMLIIKENVEEIFNADWIISSETTKNITNEIEDAKVLFVIGRGVNGKEEVKKVEEIALKFGGVVAGTKKVIDHGWLPLEKMIGQTGKIVSPDICIVLGASGATPFINGIQNSKLIIVVNKDKDARIFEYADFGIVEDYKWIISKLNDLIKE